MIYQVMSVYDSKARAYLLPIFCSHQDIGIRAFGDAANSPDHQVCKHPEDFTLFLLGSWNDDNCEFVPLDRAINLGLASNFKKAVINVQHQTALESVSDEALILTGAKGGNSEIDLR